MKQYLNPAIQEKLTQLGGKVESGGYAGKPKIQIVHGDDEMIFMYGRERHRFVKLGSGKVIWKRWFVSPELHAELGKWIVENLPKHDNPALPLRLSRFFETANTLEFIELQESDNPHSETIAPKDWMYVADINEYREEILLFYFVLQYVSPDQLPDTEESWNGQRWGVAFCPEVQANVMLDILGPFPKDGLYFVQLLDLYETDEKGVNHAIEPTWESVIVPIEKMIRERDALSIAAREKDERNAKFFESMDNLRKTKSANDWKEFDDISKDLRPAFVDSSAWVTKPEPKI